MRLLCWRWSTPSLYWCEQLWEAVLCVFEQNLLVHLLSLCWRRNTSRCCSPLPLHYAPPQPCLRAVKWALVLLEQQPNRPENLIKDNTPLTPPSSSASPTPQDERVIDIGGHNPFYEDRIWRSMFHLSGLRVCVTFCPCVCVFMMQPWIPQWVCVCVCVCVCGC